MVFILKYLSVRLARMTVLKHLVILLVESIMALDEPIGPALESSDHAKLSVRSNREASLPSLSCCSPSSNYDAM